MGTMLDPKTMKLVQAIEQFMENPPRDLPQGLPEQLTELGKGLRGYETGGEELSPGQREAVKAGMEPPKTEGTGESYKKVALAEEEKSPGQREFENAMNAARDAFNAQSAGNEAAA